MVGRSRRIAFVGLGILFLTASCPPARAHEVFLDFDHDNNLWTIDPISLQTDDILTVILEAGDDPITAGDIIELGFQTAVCDTFQQGHIYEYCGVWFEPAWGIEQWCNEEIFEFCEFTEGTGSGCEPPVVLLVVAPGIVLEPGDRYPLCYMLAHTSWLPCEHWAEAQVWITPGHICWTNRIWLVTAPAHVPEEDIWQRSEDAPSTWGGIKQRFR